MIADVTRWSIVGYLVLLVCVGIAAARPAELPRLKVSENGRFLVKADGSPFFWLGDTAWWIRRIGPSDVELYLTTRARQGFTVIHVHPGYDAPDYAGSIPFLNGDTDTPNEAFYGCRGRVKLQLGRIPVAGATQTASS